MKRSDWQPPSAFTAGCTADIRQLLESCGPEWVARQDGGGHLQLRHSSGRRVAVSRTARERGRAVKNTRAALRRIERQAINPTKGQER